MSDIPEFTNCDADYVFAEISKKLLSSETRALWSRLHNEIRRKGASAAATYLHGEFDRNAQDFAAELERAKAAADR